MEAGQGKHILVVDDDRFTGGMTAQMLEYLGYQASVACGGEDALAYLRECPVDLLVLDMFMPGGMDGAETYVQVLKVRPGTRAIILSGFPETDRVWEAQAAGAGTYLCKPVTLQRLARAVQAELERQ